jgi:hypothetical protein
MIGAQMLADMGVDASVAGLVLTCPDPEHSMESGTLADMVGLENAKLTGTVTEIVAEARSESQDPSMAVERVMKHFAEKDAEGRLVREAMPPLAQKKT